MNLIYRRLFSSLAGIALILGLLLAPACSPKPYQIKSEPPARPYTWVEIGPESPESPNSGMLVRTITAAPRCPMLQVGTEAGTTRQEMQVRTTATEDFPVRVCEAAIPRTAKTVQLDGRSLKLPRPKPQRILILGDTGCRVKIWAAGRDIQNCNDPKEWPFLKISETAAKWKPDLVIHVGDYLYRETPCPEGNTGCVGSPYGKNWATWDADFFQPARALLESAPWIFVRGNHELCSRAGEGWFKFLDPRPYESVCRDYTDPYRVKIGAKHAVVLDSANAEDLITQTAQLQEYEAQFKKVKALGPKNHWLLTHKPVWAVIRSMGPTGFIPPLINNRTLQIADRDGVLNEFEWAMAGHIHLFEVLRFEPLQSSKSGPSQMVIGNGGSHLSPLPGELKGLKVGTRTIQDGFAMQNFGFVTLEASPSLWKAVVRNAEGKALKTFDLHQSH